MNKVFAMLVLSGFSVVSLLAFQNAAPTEVCALASGYQFPTKYKSGITSQDVDQSSGAYGHKCSGTHGTIAGEKYREIATDDGNEVFLPASNKGKSVADLKQVFLKKRIKLLKLSDPQSQVDAVGFEVGNVFGRLRYQVRASGVEADTTVPDGKINYNIETSLPSIPEAQRTDALATVLEYVTNTNASSSKHIRTYVAMRMDDIHDSLTYAMWSGGYSNFKRQHRDLQISPATAASIESKEAAHQLDQDSFSAAVFSTYPYPIPLVNGAKQPVRWSSIDYGSIVARQYVYTIIRDILTNPRYAKLDGLELNFTRSSSLFRSFMATDAASASEIAAMTEFMRNIRVLANQFAEVNKHPLRINVVSGDSIALNKGIGLDLETWAHEGLFDSVATSDYSQVSPELAYQEAIHALGKQVYGTIGTSDYSVQSHGDLRDTPAGWAGRAAYLLSQKSDGIYLYNWWTTGDHTDIGSMDAIAPLDLKYYFASPSGDGSTTDRAPVKYLQRRNIYLANPVILHSYGSLSTHLRLPEDPQSLKSVELVLMVRAASKPKSNAIAVSNLYKNVVYQPNTADYSSDHFSDQCLLSKVSGEPETLQPCVDTQAAVYEYRYAPWDSYEIVVRNADRFLRKYNNGLTLTSTVNETLLIEDVYVRAGASTSGSPAPTATPVPTATPKPTATPAPTPKPTATPVSTPKPTATPVPTPKPTATPVPTPRPTATPVPTPRPTATPNHRPPKYGDPEPYEDF